MSLLPGRKETQPATAKQQTLSRFGAAALQPFSVLRPFYERRIAFRVRENRLLSLTPLPPPFSVFCPKREKNNNNNNNKQIKNSHFCSTKLLSSFNISNFILKNQKVIKCIYCPTVYFIFESEREQNKLPFCWVVKVEFITPSNVSLCYNFERMYWSKFLS